MQQRHRHFFSNDRYPLLFLFFAWVVVQIFLFFQFGIETSYEAAKYIEQANHLLQNGSYSTHNFLFYSTEILLIALALKLHAGFVLVILIQLVLNAISLYLFYQLVLGLTKRRTIAFLLSLLLLAMLYYQLYNVYLFTESIFFSLSTIFVWQLFSERQFSFPYLLGVLATLLLLIFTRPTGLLFVPPTVLYLALKFGGAKRLLLSLICASAGLLIFYFLTNKALGSGGEFDFLLPYVQEHTICGVATVQEQHQIQVPVNQNSIEGLLYVMKNYSGLFLRLGVKRLAAFWGATRPYYSALHNVYLAAYFYGIYLLILFGIRRLFRHFFPEAVFLFGYVFLVMLTVMLSCDEWHNRFLFSILPFLLLLAASAFLPKTEKQERSN